MVSFATFNGTLAEFKVKGDVKLFSPDKSVNNRVMDLAGAIITAKENSQINFIQPTPESRSERKTRERAERETALIDGGHELLKMIEDPKISVDNRFFNEKIERLMALMDRIQKDTPKKYYADNDEQVLNSLRTFIDYVERLDKDFETSQAENSRIYCRETGYATELAKAKFHNGGVYRTLDFIWHLWLEQHDMLAECLQQHKVCVIL